VSEDQLHDILSEVDANKNAQVDLGEFLQVRHRCRVCVGIVSYRVNLFGLLLNNAIDVKLVHDHADIISIARRVAGDFHRPVNLYAYFCRQRCKMMMSLVKFLCD